MPKYVPPTLNGKAFTCPACGAIAQQLWSAALYHQLSRNMNYEVIPISRCICVACKSVSFWSDVEAAQIFPRAASAPMPHTDMPEDVKKDYLEARLIASDSPRAAAALLRLSAQKLLAVLGGKGKNIDDDIAMLVAKGLPPQVRDALDICRVVGNNAVHPGEINVHDEPGLVAQLFTLINFIVSQTIEREKALASMMEKLPQGAKDAIVRRDAKASAATPPVSPPDV